MTEIPPTPHTRHWQMMAAWAARAFLHDIMSGKNNIKNIVRLSLEMIWGNDASIHLVVVVLTHDMFVWPGVQRWLMAHDWCRAVHTQLHRSPDHEGSVRVSHDTDVEWDMGTAVQEQF